MRLTNLGNVSDMYTFATGNTFQYLHVRLDVHSCASVLSILPNNDVVLKFRWFVPISDTRLNFAP